MGLVIYTGNPTPVVVTLPDGERLTAENGKQYELPLEVCAALIASGKWVAGNEETETYKPPAMAATVPFGPLATAPYAAHTVYPAGTVVVEDGVQYVALKATHDETPSANPGSWKSVGLSEVPPSVVTGSGTPKKGSVAVAKEEGGNGSPILFEVGEDGSAWVADSSQAVGVVWKKAEVFDITAPPFKASGSAADNHEAILKAIEAAEAVGAGIVYFPPSPTGVYKTSKGFIYASQKNIHIVGSYANSTLELTADLEFGKHVFEMPESETASNSSPFVHWFENVNLKGHATWPGSPTKAALAGYTPSLAMGFEVASNVRLRNCKAEGFYAGFDFRGNHQLVINCEAANCFYARYWGPARKEGGSYGSQGFVNWQGGTSYFAGTGVHPDNECLGIDFSADDNGRAPYGFYKEGPQGERNSFSQTLTSEGLYDEYFGNAYAYDENTASSLSGTLAPGTGVWAGTYTENGSAHEPGGRIGNAQTLTITATGGFYKLVIPSETGMTGGTTAAIAATATNAEIEAKIKAVISTGKAVVTTVGGAKQILLLEKAALVAGKEITVETGELTGGSASLSAPYVDPESGPRTRPVNAQKIVVANATGGTYEVKISVEGVETSFTIAWNASAAAMAKALRALSNVGAFGVVVTPTSGPYYLSFNGSLLGKTVTVTVNGAGLTGSGPTVVVEAGPEAKLSLRHEEFAIDVGAAGPLEFNGTTSEIGVGEKGWLRAKEVTNNITVRGSQATTLAQEKAIQEGTKVLISAGDPGNHVHLFYTATGLYRVGYATGPVTRGQNLASSNYRGEVVVYPTESSKGSLARPHAGFANATVAEGTKAAILVLINAYGFEFLVPYDAESTPGANKYLKPSSKTAGEVTVCTEASDHIVGVTVAAGSGGTVKAVPVGVV
jgi:hypothetical protein